MTLRKQAVRSRKFLIHVAVCLIYTGGFLSSFQVDSEAAEKKSLWRIRSKNNVVYLLGSIHYLKSENYPLADAIEAAFRDANRVVFEIDMEGAQGQAQQLMAFKGLYTDGRTLKDHVTPETYALAERQFTRVGLDIQIFNQFKPWFTALSLLAVKLQALGFDPSQGIDSYFSRKAKQEKKETSGLETLEYQFDLFDKLPQRVQEALLLQALSGGESTEAAVNSVVKAWAAGDLQALDALLLRDWRDYPELYQSLVVNRNRAWLPKIESYLWQNENTLVIVGAGHLGGNDGLIEMLKARGYSVEQL
jgi:uncharacterized protein